MRVQKNLFALIYFGKIQFFTSLHLKSPVPEFIDPRFHENKPKTLVFSHRKRAFWACFRENCVYNFGHRSCRTASAHCVQSFLFRLSRMWKESPLQVNTYLCNMLPYPIMCMLTVITECRPPPPSSSVAKAGRNHLNEEITPSSQRDRRAILPNHIKFRTCSALAPM
jgi:hypothetical protein